MVNRFWVAKGQRARAWPDIALWPREPRGMEQVPAHLQRDDVSCIPADFVHDPLLPVAPFQSPGGAVAVHLPSCVLVTQHVVTHHCERTWWGRPGLNRKIDLTFKRDSDSNQIILATHPPFCLQGFQEVSSKLGNISDRRRVNGWTDKELCPTQVLWTRRCKSRVV